MMMMTGLAFFLSAASFQSEPVVTAVPEVKLTLGYKVTDRQIAAEPADHAYRPAESVFAWTQISGLRTGFVEHVWYRNGQEVARHYLPVSNGRSWRTWSRHTVQAGDYKLLVLGPDGAELASSTFSVKKGE
jgi:Protein of unknown function (DUF2914)